MGAKYPDLGQARQTARQARRTYPFTSPPELGSGEARHYPVVIAGGGPIGLALALDLAGKGVRSVVLEKYNTVSDGSRAICWAKRTLEICDRLGSGERMLDKGVIWNIGKVYFGADPDPIYTFDLLPDKAQKFPAFINLQQFYGEEYLIELLEERPEAELRWQNEVIAVDNEPERVAVTVKTPEGDYKPELRLSDRRGRSSKSGSEHARTRFRGTHLRGSFPHCRRANESGFSRGAALLVRSTVQSRPNLAAPQAGR